MLQQNENAVLLPIGRVRVTPTILNCNGISIRIGLLILIGSFNSAAAMENY
jgi:hypothetical protein